MPQASPLSDITHHILINHRGRNQLSFFRYGPITLGEIKSSLSKISFLGANNSVQMNFQNNSQIILHNVLLDSLSYPWRFCSACESCFSFKVIYGIVISSKRLFCAQSVTWASVGARKCEGTFFVCKGKKSWGGTHCEQEEKCRTFSSF